MTPPLAGWSLEARALVAPTATYRAMAANPSVHVWRRPLFLALLLGCGVSYLASGRLTARIVVDGGVSYAFGPACVVIGLAGALWMTSARVPLHRAIDHFFVGHAPWHLWIIGASIAACFVWPMYWSLTLFEVSAFAPVVWSARLDYLFFREVAGMPNPDAIRAVLFQRLIAWTLATLYFLGIAIYSEVLPGIWQWMVT